MYNIQTLNSISPVYHNILRNAEYRVDAQTQNPDAILVRSANMHDMTFGDRLLCVGRAGAGVNNIPLDRMAEDGIVVFNTPGANANAVKELVVAGMLLGSRRITEGVEWCKTLNGQDNVEALVEKGKNQFVGPELLGKTLGVIGLGAIGVLVANMGVSLGMNVLGYDPFISVDHAWKLSRSVHHSQELIDIFEKSDYLTLHLPLTDSTRSMIDESSMARIKNGAVLLNFSRGGLVDTDAVLNALKSGKLSRYVTDFPSAGLFDAPNTLLIPHLGASTPESEDNCVRMVARQIDDYLKHGSIVNSCNFPNCTLSPCTMPRLAVLHKNVPKVISAITSAVSAENLNIENMVNQSRNGYAYTVVDTDGQPSKHLVEKLSAMDAVYRVRVLRPLR
ncbi:MAG: phosphoglycerate dehydrogenase [Christensenellales bacterium]|nr:phosphoglycerate dehydrogenase [Christensenellales bacterium]